MTNSACFNSIFNAQQTLTHMQRKPVAGPLLAAPLKFVCSIIQMVGGLIGSIATAPLHCFAKTQSIATTTNKIALHGAVETISALGTFLTLGYLK